MLTKLSETYYVNWEAVAYVNIYRDAYWLHFSGLEDDWLSSVMDSPEGKAIAAHLEGQVIAQPRGKGALVEAAKEARDVLTLIGSFGTRFEVTPATQQILGEVRARLAAALSAEEV